MNAPSTALDQDYSRNGMDHKAASQNLQALACDSKMRSKTALLRDLLDQVESAFAAGVTHAAVLDSLNHDGLNMTLGTFEVTVRRLRAQKAKRSLTKSNTSPSPSPSSIPAAPPPSQGSHDPADLDKIFRSVPDMNTYAKLGRERLKKK